MLGYAGHLKFFDTHLLSEETGFNLCQMSRHHYPLAPEQMKSLGEKSSSAKFNPIHAEMWTIGLIFLCIATLHVEDYFYDWEALRVREDRVEQALLQLKRDYSKLLAELVTKLLITDPLFRGSLKFALGCVDRRIKEDQPY